jgi:hypothetical protein
VIPIRFEERTRGTALRRWRGTGARTVDARGSSAAGEPTAAAIVSLHRRVDARANAGDGGRRACGCASPLATNAVNRTCRGARATMHRIGSQGNAGTAAVRLPCWTCAGTRHALKACSARLAAAAAILRVVRQVHATSAACDQRSRTRIRTPTVLTDLANRALDPAATAVIRIHTRVYAEAVAERASGGANALTIRADASVRACGAAAPAVLRVRHQVDAGSIAGHEALAA